MKCPTCKRQVEWQGNLFRPFCSERCKLIDLGKWVSEEYRVPGSQSLQNKLPKKKVLAKILAIPERKTKPLR